MILPWSSSTPRPITDVRILRGKHDIWSRAVIFSVCFASAAVANAQLAETDSPSERDDRTAPAPPSPGTSEEGPPAHNGPAAIVNLLFICQMIGSAAAANGLPFEFLARVIWQESRFKPDAVGPRPAPGRRAALSPMLWGLVQHH
jgi:hypothetical protein